MLAIYVRLSVENEESTSILKQIREGKEFADNNNLTYQIYNEGEGVSGTLDIKDRPELNKLISDITEGKVTTIWMRNQNRMERNSLTFHLFADIIKKNNIKLYFADGKEVDYNDPNTFLSSSILSTLNAYSAQLQSVQTKKSLKDNAKEGKAHGILPYGYSKDSNGFIIVDVEESEIVKRIYELSLKGTGTNKIAESLNKESVPTRYNKIAKGTISTINKQTGEVTTKEKTDIKWAGNTIRNILTNTFYKGIRNFGGAIYEVPVIIEPLQWRKVNDNLKNNANNPGKQTEHKYLLKGVLECLKCGRNMCGRTRNNKKDNYYMCSSKRYKDDNCGNRSINIDVLNSIIWGRFFLDNDYKDFLVESLKDNDNKEKYIELEALSETHEKGLVNLSDQKKRAIKLAIQGILKDEEVRGEIDSIDKKIEDVKIKLYNLKEETEELKKVKERIKGIETDFKTVAKDTSFNRKQEIIKKYIRRIKIIYSKEMKGYIIYISPYLRNKTELMILDRNYKIALSMRTGKGYNLTDKSRKDFEKNFKDLEGRINAEILDIQL